jgi:secondary thiamine-phosphate synthase enzyme
MKRSFLNEGSAALGAARHAREFYHPNSFAAAKFFDARYALDLNQHATRIQHMHSLKVRSHQREELVEFTEQVQEQLSESGAKEGVVILYVQHTTAGLTVNENADPDVPRDMLHALRTLIPQHGMGFRHGEENSDAHIKASLVGPTVTIPFSEGKLLLGRWQGIFLCEFDGGRERKVIMTIR